MDVVRRYGEGHDDGRGHGEGEGFVEMDVIENVVHDVSNWEKTPVVVVVAGKRAWGKGVAGRRWQEHDCKRLSLRESLRSLILLSRCKYTDLTIGRT